MQFHHYIDDTAPTDLTSVSSSNGGLITYCLKMWFPFLCVHKFSAHYTQRSMLRFKIQCTACSSYKDVAFNLRSSIARAKACISSELQMFKQIEWNTHSDLFSIIRFQLPSSIIVPMHFPASLWSSVQCGSAEFEPHEIKGPFSVQHVVHWSGWREQYRCRFICSWSGTECATRGLEGYLYIWDMCVCPNPQNNEPRCNLASAGISCGDLMVPPPTVSCASVLIRKSTSLDVIMHLLEYLAET